MNKKFAIFGAIMLCAAALSAAPATAAPPVQLSGAIFTTDSSGDPVNLNIYDSKESVYLNGGPGVNAPEGAAGLPAGTYSFQVTEPNGELLSTDDVSCRQFTVDASGSIVGVVDNTCEHATGTGGEDSGATVQLFPYADTTNNGGVYKVWVSPTNLLDCNAPGNKNCFVPRYSKVDNFKVRSDIIVEIDVRFWKNGAAMDGYKAEWTDTNGATNVKYSEYNPAVLAFHEAHFEATEQGRHSIKVQNQPGCDIAAVQLPDGSAGKVRGNSSTVSFDVAAAGPGADVTYWVDVSCK